MSNTRTWTNVDAALWSRTTATASGCLEFRIGISDHGYGRVRFAGRGWYAHRLAWVTVHGPIPAGMFVCHRCDNPPCVNPAHLFLGSNADNLHDMWRKGRGHASVALTPEQIATVRTAPDSPTLARLAAVWGVSVRTLYRARKPQYGAWALFRGQREKVA